MMVLMVSVTSRTHAQGGGGPPSELTIAELRQALQFFQSLNRSRAMFGLESLGAEAALTLQLLEAEFDENVLPGLLFAEQDCFFAEVPLLKALSWLRNVQLLGLDKDWGPLWEEAAVVQDSMYKIVRNCHTRLYEKCVLDDSDPDAALLPSVTRSMMLIDGDPVYEEKSRRCSIGWTGYLTVKESLQGNMTLTQAAGPTSATTRAVANGTRDVKIDLLNKSEGSVGTADGRVDENMTTVASVARCTSTSEQVTLIQSRGSGDALLTKHSSPTGELTLAFAGPTEDASISQSVTMAFNDPQCGGNASLPAARQPLPGSPWPGLLNDRLNDPLTEMISGSRTLLWVINAAGVPTPAREGESGEASRIPAIPGLPAGTSAYPLYPWVGLSQPMPDAGGERPTIRMEIKWELVFGGG
ncbi:MAG TPA: hypothetical protein VFX49_21390 [Chloroflexota bacterium]|nr:hypothetical protein [Chloroflexota bacterium]